MLLKLESHFPKEVGITFFKGNPLKIIKTAFYFIIKTIFFFKIIKKARVNFKNYDIINWETNNYNTHIVQYLKN